MSPKIVTISNITFSPNLFKNILTYSLNLFLMFISLLDKIYSILNDFRKRMLYKFNRLNPRYS